jgi:N-acetylglucosaminyldiphosphoundecaprenol N-acetyl-beta-D-mannosaminyltransferase
LTRAVRILDVEVDAVTLAQAVTMIGEAVDARGGHGATTFQVATVNPEFIMRARLDHGFRQILQGAALRTADGAGLMLAGRILHHRLPERVTGMDLTLGVARAAAERGDRVFFLGAAPGVAEAAARELARELPRLQVAGVFAGDSSEAGDNETLAAVRAGNPDIVLVAYGAPAQELWLGRNLDISGAAAGIGVGGTFDYLSGRVRRAPAWMRRFGLEWLYRLLHEPSRARRMAVLPVFLLLVIRQRLGSRATR